jgi:hypothetical protein
VGEPRVLSSYAFNAVCSKARDENGANGLAPLPRVPLRPGALMIAIEPRENQRPEVVVHGEVTVDEGATEILSPAVLSVNDSDTLVVGIVGGPKHGYLEVRDRSGERKCSFLYFFVFRQVLNHFVCGKPTHDKTYTHEGCCC